MIFFKLMDKLRFRKAIENAWQHKYIRFVVNKRVMTLSTVSQIITTKWFSEKFVAIEINKAEVKMKKPLYLSLSILNISKIVMDGYWYDYAKPKYGDKAKLSYTDMDNVIVHAKFEDVYADLPGDDRKRYETSNYEGDSPLPIGITKN